MRDLVADKLAADFPGVTEFVVLTKTDWDKVARYLRRVGVTQEIRDLNVLSVEMEEAP